MLQCYRCGHKMVKAGTSIKGYQRYRCTGCGHSFTSTTELVNYHPRAEKIVNSSGQKQSPGNASDTPVCKNSTTAIEPVIRWFFSVLLVLVALAGLLSGGLSAIGSIFLLCSAFIASPLSKRIATLQNRKKYILLSVILAVIGFALIVAGL